MSGICPQPGYSVATFSAAYPRALVSRMASSLLGTKSGSVVSIKQSVFAKLACWILIQFRCHHRKNHIHLVIGSKILNGFMRFVITLTSFFPSCASVALARSSHNVVLMNELSRCISNVPPWGVKSEVRTFTQSEVLLGQPKNKKHTNKAKPQNKAQTKNPARKALTIQLQWG